jgi:hypothetical protein
MNLSQLINQVSNNVNGSHTAYDDNKSFVVIPVPSNRYQSVLAEYVTKDDIKFIEVSSKICEESNTPDKLFYLEKNLIFSKLAIKNDFLQVVCYLDENMNPALATLIIKEVATFADEQESLLTDQDIH